MNEQPEIISTTKSEDKASYWRRILDEWKNSGESQKRFCERRELSFCQFGYWRKRFNGHKKKLSGFSEITVMSNKADGSSDLKLTLPSGLEIQVGRYYDEQTLSRLLRTLGMSLC